MKRLSVFIVVLVSSALVAWLSGYDFDYRGVWVAYWAVVTLCFAGIAAAHPDLK